METAVAIPSQPIALSAQEFDLAVQDAQAKAKTLQRIVESQKLYANVGGKKYLEVEAWQTIAAAYGYAASIEWTRQLQDGGWEARAVVLDPMGQVVGAAEAECGTKGDTPWDKRASYQQRSMAQTRAVSKALRSRLSWVVVLAGYSATPAEEMPRDEASRPAQKASLVVGTEDLKRMFAKARECGVSEDAIRDHLMVEHGITSTRQMKPDQYAEVMEWIQANKSEVAA